MEGYIQRFANGICARLHNLLLLSIYTVGLVYPFQVLDFFSYSGIFIIFAVTRLAKFTSIIVNALCIKATGFTTII